MTSCRYTMIVPAQQWVEEMKEENKKLQLPAAYDKK